MRFYDVPVISGSTEEQLEQIKNYLFLQQEQLNYNLGQQQPAQIFAAAQAALRNAGSPIESEQVRSEYQGLRDLIIGTAEEAIKAGDTYTRTLRQMQTFRGEFGIFKEEITREVSETAEATAENFTYIGQVETALSEYKLEQQNFIKSGYLDTTATPPVFGVEIGMLKSSYTVDGQTISATPEKIRITPGRIGFWTQKGQELVEAAYITQGAVYFPNAQITGGSINIGGGAFKVSAAGVLEATGAKIGGKITAGSGSTIGGWNISDNAIWRGSKEKFDEVGVQYFGKDGLSLGTYFKVQPDGEMTCTKATIGGWEVKDSSIERALSGLSNAVNAILDGSGMSFGVYSGTGSTTNYSGIDASGILRARGAIISGDITANTGHIGGWEIGTEADKRLKKLNSSGNGIQLIPGNNPQIKITMASPTTSSVSDLVAEYWNNPMLYCTDGNNEAMLTPVGLFAANKTDDEKWAYIGPKGSWLYGGLSVVGQLNITEDLTTVGGALIGGDLLVIGSLNWSSNTIQTETGNTTLSSGSWDSLCYMDLTAGKWLLRGYGQFDNKAGGNRQIILTTSSYGGAEAGNGASSAANSGTTIMVNAVRLVTVENDTRFYLRAYQNSGNNLSVSGGIEAIKLA